MLQYLLAFLSGLLVKAVDWIDDERGGKSPLRYPLAIAYGACIGCLLSQSSFAMLFLAALFAQVFARKIDTHTHVLGFVVALAALFFLGAPQFEPWLFGLFLLLAFLDELEMGGKYEFISEYRPFLKIGALLFVPLGRWDFLLAILAFDFGYVLFEWLAMRCLGGRKGDLWLGM